VTDRRKAAAELTRDTKAWSAGGVPHAGDLNVISPRDPAWLAFLERSDEATIFHHPAWMDLLARSYGYCPFALVSLNSAETIEAGMGMMKVVSRIRGARLISLPFTDYCPPLVDDEHASERFGPRLAGWLDGAAGLTLEIRHKAPPSSGLHTVTVGVRHVLALDPDVSVVFRRFDGSVARAIRKSQRAGLTSEVTTNLESMAVFHRLHCLTRRRLGVPVQPRRFLAGVWDLLRQEFGFAVVVRNGGLPIAAGVFLTWNRTAIYKFGASDHTSWSLRPNNLLMWTAIEKACEKGCTVFDFGRTELGNQGLDDFKSRWGTHRIPLEYSYSGAIPRTGEGRGMRAARAVIRSSPVIVSSLAGELLYKYLT
jgi:CelD/BcsL family acetyltransferase involved in cellulose biosynthesis